MLLGTRTAPAWIVSLEAAKTWARPPWELVGGSPAIWWLRYKVAREVEAEAAQKKHEIAEQEAQMRRFLNG